MGKGCSRPSWLALAVVVCALASALVATVAGHTREENVAFAEKILGYLNNNLECTLPTFEEVDELQLAFTELQSQGFSLTTDQQLVQRTVLEFWDSFRKTMRSPVIVRSAKKRSFLCKIEDYQIAKFGSSVCTRVKEIRGPLTDRIFEKNPLVRYLKHLDTGEVVDPPPPATTTETPPVATTEVQNVTPIKIEVTPTTTTTTTTTTEAPTTEIATTTEAVVAVEEPSAELSPPVAVVEDHHHNHHQQEEDAQRELAKEETQMNDVKHNFIGQFTFEFNEMPRKIEITIEQNGGNDNERDPLDDIPVPPVSDDEISTDKKEEEEEEEEEVVEPEPEVETETPLPPPVTQATTTTTTTPLPMFDEFGAEYVEAEYDDASLDKLVRVPKRDWAFDPIYGYFKWPDECNADACPVARVGPLDDQILGSSGAWSEFLADPYAYDERVERANAEATRRPKINQAWLRSQKKRLMLDLGDAERRAKTFGWDASDVPLELRPFGDKGRRQRWAPVMPELKRDRWLKLADNNYCKLGFNRGRIADSTKNGYKAVKSLFKGQGGDAFNSRKKLLSNGGGGGAGDGSGHRHKSKSEFGFE